MGHPKKASIETEVRYFETDQMGIVHHANYLVWFELARTRLCATSGYHYSEIEDLGYRLLTTGADLRYRQSARYGDTCEVSCWIERLGSRVIVFAYEVRRGGDTLVTGHTEHMWVRSADHKLCSIPEPLRAPFDELAGRQP